MKLFGRILGFPFAILVKWLADWSFRPSREFEQRGGDGKQAMMRSFARLFYGGCTLVLLIGILLGTGCAALIF